MSVCKLICNLCKEHCMLGSDSIISTSFFSVVLSVQHPSPSLAGCVAASATAPRTDVRGSADGQHPEPCLPSRYQLSVNPPPPHHHQHHPQTHHYHLRPCPRTENLASKRPGWTAASPNTTGRCYGSYIEGNGAGLFGGGAYVDSCSGGLQVWTEPQTVETFGDWMEKNRKGGKKRGKKVRSRVNKGRGKWVCGWPRRR